MADDGRADGRARPPAGRGPRVRRRLPGPGPRGRARRGARHAARVPAPAARSGARRSLGGAALRLGRPVTTARRVARPMGCAAAPVVRIQHRARDGGAVAVAPFGGARLRPGATGNPAPMSTVSGRASAARLPVMRRQSSAGRRRVAPLGRVAVSPPHGAATGDGRRRPRPRAPTSGPVRGSGMPAPSASRGRLALQETAPTARPAPGRLARGGSGRAGTGDVAQV